MLLILCKTLRKYLFRHVKGWSMVNYQCPRSKISWNSSLYNCSLSYLLNTYIIFQSFHNENYGEEQVAHRQHGGGNGSGREASSSEKTRETTEDDHQTEIIKSSKLNVLKNAPNKINKFN